MVELPPQDLSLVPVPDELLLSNRFYIIWPLIFPRFSITYRQAFLILYTQNAKIFNTYFLKNRTLRSGQVIYNLTAFSLFSVANAVNRLFSIPARPSPAGQPSGESAMG